MKRTFSFLILVIVAYSCRKTESATNSYPTYDYLIVKQQLDTLNASFSANGYKPTVSVFKKGKKQLTFFGASHVRDTEHPQFKAIEAAFRQQNPQIAFNEGGQIPETEHYASRDSAILVDGETGLVKYLCDQQHIKLLNGDMSTDEEFVRLLTKCPREKLFLYLGIERFLQPFSQGFDGKMAIEEAYQKSFIDYLEKYNFKPTAQEKKLSYLYELYSQYFKQKVDLKNLIRVHEYYLTDKGAFGKIGRASKKIRDQVLLKKIDKALDKYDNVFVVFGGSHWVAVQPALKYIIEKQR